MTWAPGGVRVGGDRGHQIYLDRLARHLSDLVRRRLLECFKEEALQAQKTEDEDATEIKETLFDEISDHIQFFQSR